MNLTETQFLADLERDPGGHCRKPHYWFKPNARAIYIVVWRAWWRGLCTIPLFDMRITPAGIMFLQEDARLAVPIPNA